LKTASKPDARVNLGVDFFSTQVTVPALGGFVALEKQVQRLHERRTSRLTRKCVCAVPFDVFPRVYDTGLDTELMIESIRIGRSERFLEIGCGTGAVSILTALRSREGIGVDISWNAIANAKHNADMLKVQNVLFLQSDVFRNVKRRFDVLVCNPPYSCYPARDAVDRMFWDPENEMKRKFFAGAHARLTKGGRIYFGWADFRDIDSELPFRLADNHGFAVAGVRQRSSRSGEYTFIVFEFQRNRNSNEA
jgi:methylase of polypeptide subunit release factors